MANAFKAIGQPFKELGTPRRRARQPESSRSRQVKMTTSRSLNYERIKQEVMAAIAQLSQDKQAQIPMDGTLPEIMVALALCWLGLRFQCQQAELGGRLRLGGGVIDLLVDMGGVKPIAVRVNGDYWHTLPDRVKSDAVQYMRLVAKGYRVCDLWENAIYKAWTEGQLKQFVEEGLLNAS